MFEFKPDVRVWLGTKPIDMRCAIDGLLIQIAGQLKMEPQRRQLFLFVSKGKDKVKGLWWDKNGFVMIYKRLEKGRFKLPAKLIEEKLEITLKQLEWLLLGMDFSLLAEDNLPYKNYC